MRLSYIVYTYQKRFKQKNKFEKNFGGAEGGPREVTKRFQWVIKGYRGLEKVLRGSRRF